MGKTSVDSMGHLQWVRPAGSGMLPKKDVL